MTVRAARADREKTNKRRTKDEQKTNKRRTKDEQKTNNERRKGGEMMKDKACKIVEKVEFVEGDYG